VGEGDEIIVSEEEHHSNIVPWQMLCQRKKATLKVLRVDDEGHLKINDLSTLITSRTKIVAVTHISNVLGIINPVKEIVNICHSKGCPVLVDGAQGIVHQKVDVQDLDCDFYAFSGHKIYAATGTGVLYGKKKWLEQMVPYQGGGEMIDHVRWNGTTYNVLPYKFEAGTPDFVGSYALHKAIEYMQQAGLERIQAEEQDLAAYCEHRLSEIEGVHIYAAGQPKAGVISFNVFANDRLIHPFDVGTLLDHQGIAVRTGHHCAEPLIDSLGVPGTVRVSFGLYNDRHDIDAFIDALRKAITMLS
jgi:cysteine desulfurase/selenocysteine lyase